LRARLFESGIASRIANTNQPASARKPQKDSPQSLPGRKGRASTARRGIPQRDAGDKLAPLRFRMTPRKIGRGGDKNCLTDRAGQTRIGRPWIWSGKGFGVGRGKPRFLGSARRYLGLWRLRFGLFGLRRLRILLVQLVPLARHHCRLARFRRTYGTLSMALPQQQRKFCTAGAPTKGSRAIFISQRQPEFTHR
jgi:hypothetical protein